MSVYILDCATANVKTKAKLKFVLSMPKQYISNINLRLEMFHFFLWISKCSRETWQSCSIILPFLCELLCIRKYACCVQQLNIDTF